MGGAWKPREVVPLLSSAKLDRALKRTEPLDLS